MHLALKHCIGLSGTSEKQLLDNTEKLCTLWGNIIWNLPEVYPLRENMLYMTPTAFLNASSPHIYL